MHYANVNQTAVSFNSKHDCPGNCCVPKAIANYTAILTYNQTAYSTQSSTVLTQLLHDPSSVLSQATLLNTASRIEMNLEKVPADAYSNIWRGVAKPSNYYELSAEERVAAAQLSSDVVPEPSSLSFLVHFVGDCHQPLHVSYSCDQGGNFVNVSIFEQDTELHFTWDSVMLVGSLPISRRMRARSSKRRGVDRETGEEECVRVESLKSARVVDNSCEEETREVLESSQEWRERERECEREGVHKDVNATSSTHPPILLLLAFSIDTFSRAAFNLPTTHFNPSRQIPQLFPLSRITTIPVGTVSRMICNSTWTATSRCTPNTPRTCHRTCGPTSLSTTHATMRTISSSSRTTTRAILATCVRTRTGPTWRTTTTTPTSASSRSVSHRAAFASDICSTLFSTRPSRRVTPNTYYLSLVLNCSFPSDQDSGRL
jgi:S1/P1 Nuclease